MGNMALVAEGMLWNANNLVSPLLSCADNWTCFGFACLFCLLHELEIQESVKKVSSQVSSPSVASMVGPLTLGWSI